MILKCSCQNKGQDEIHGVGRRVHNITNNESWRCTVCVKEQNAPNKPANGKKQKGKK